MSEGWPELHAWIRRECGTGCPVRDEAVMASLAALVHRLLKFGVEDVTERLSARDCLLASLCCGGPGAVFFIRLALVRALIENDEPVVCRLLQTPLIPEHQEWLRRIARLMMGDVEGAQDWLDSLRPEERAISSLVLGRQLPHLAESMWLTECPTQYPQLAAELALVLLRAEPNSRKLVESYLRARPAVRYAVDQERWP